MSRRTRSRLTAIAFAGLLGLGAIGFFGFYLGSAHVQGAKAETNTALLQILPDDAVIGQSDAPVTIIEYSSMSCPHCASFHKTVFPSLKQKYIDTGAVKFVNRHFPLNEPALRAGMLTLCVGDQQVKFTEVLFDLQEKWAFTADFKENLKKIAAVGGVTPDQFDACMANKELEDKLVNSRARAQEQLGITSTPYFFVNGEAVTGQPSIDMFDAAIAKAQSGL